ncbi:MAG: hypothetical protein HKN73_06115 [Gemmatimonadetes bacterium]|nr:hypothetical protein [Gemmatimonadota bacterium]
MAEVSRLLAGVDARLRMGEDHDGALGLERLRLLYFLTVADEAFIPVAVQQIDALEGTDAPDSVVAPVLEAFRGALEVVRGKHAFWPHDKVGHVRNGLARLDQVVEIRPRLVEARYLRLLSSFYLPFFFRRGDTVDADMDSLADLLLERPPRMSAEAYRAVTDFVLDHGKLDPDRKARLSAAFGRLSESPSTFDARMRDVRPEGE